MDIAGIIGAIAAALVTIGGGVKYLIERNDKKQMKIIDGVNERISNLERKVEEERKKNERLIRLIAACTHEDCQVKKRLLNELDNE